MRQKKNKQLRKTYFIFCEWETEQCYFKAYRSQKRTNIKVAIDYSHLTSAKENKISDFYKKLQKRIKDFSWFSFNEFKKVNWKVFILLDADCYSKNDINYIKSYFNKKDINVLFSNYSFDFFILLHIMYYTWNDDNYIKKIQDIYDKNFDKWDNDYLKNIHKDIISNYLERFKQNIKKLENKYEKEWIKNIKEKLPFTEVSYLIDDLEN